MSSISHIHPSEASFGSQEEASSIRRAAAGLPRGTEASRPEGETSPTVSEHESNPLGEPGSRQSLSTRELGAVYTGAGVPETTSGRAQPADYPARKGARGGGGQSPTQSDSVTSAGSLFEGTGVQAPSRRQTGPPEAGTNAGGQRASQTEEGKQPIGVNLARVREDQFKAGGQLNAFQRANQQLIAKQRDKGSLFPEATGTVKNLGKFAGSFARNPLDTTKLLRGELLPLRTTPKKQTNKLRKNNPNLAAETPAPAAESSAQGARRESRLAGGQTGKPERESRIGQEDLSQLGAGAVGRPTGQLRRPDANPERTARLTGERSPLGAVQQTERTSQPRRISDVPPAITGSRNSGLLQDPNESPTSSTSAELGQSDQESRASSPDFLNFPRQ